MIILFIFISSGMDKNIRQRKRQGFREEQGPVWIGVATFLLIVYPSMDYNQHKKYFMINIYPNFLKNPEKRSAHQRWEWPGNWRQNDQKAYGEPYRHGLKFFGPVDFSFCFGRANRNNRNGHKHHRAVLHSEKTKLPFVDGRAKVLKEIGYHRTYKIKPQTEHKLYMCNRSCNVSDGIVKACKWVISQPAFVSSVYGIKETQQHQPTE